MPDPSNPLDEIEISPRLASFGTLLEGLIPYVAAIGVTFSTEDLQGLHDEVDSLIRDNPVLEHPTTERAEDVVIMLRLSQALAGHLIPVVDTVDAHLDAIVS